MEERLQKLLAQAGIASRRKCEAIILSGRVQVNGRIVNTLGAKADPGQDEIRIDGKPLRRESKVYILFHKPKGVITSVRDPEGRPTVTDYIKDIRERIFPVGRLDYETEGLLLLTNDGEWANLLMHPRHHVPKTYLATVKGVPHGDILDKLRAGIRLDDGMTAPAVVEYHDVEPDGSRSIVSITIVEGRNRQVRRMFEAIRCEVLKLRRIAYGPLTLEGLSRGKHRRLTAAEVRALREAAESGVELDGSGGLDGQDGGM